VHAINVDGSMPGVLGGVSNKVYKEVVKTPNAISHLCIGGKHRKNGSLTQRAFDYHVREARLFTRKNVHTDLRNGSRGEPVLNRRPSESRTRGKLG
jgi:hypothetical protein